MDAQKRFLASTLQGAIDAEVIGHDDLFKHLTSEVLAEHVPPEILWGCLLEGMHESGIGPGDAPPPRPLPSKPPPSKPLEAEADEADDEDDEDEDDEDVEDVDDAPPEPLEAPGGGGSIDIDVTDALDDLPPLPDDEELAVEDVDWEGEEK